MFEIYKRGQGKTSRYLAAGSVGVLSLFGCYSLYNYLNVRGSLQKLILFVVPGVELDVNLPFLVSFGFFAGLMILLYALLNKPKIGDFLIETELEMKRVSWPVRSELIGSSTIVIITVVILAVIVMVFDLAVQAFMRLIYSIG